MSLKESILGAKDLGSVKHHVGAWSCDVHLKKLSGTERAAFRKGLNDYCAAQKMKVEDLDITPYSCLFLIHVIADENGTRVFGDDDLPLLMAKSPSVINELYQAASELNAIEPKAVENAAKN